MTVLDHSLDDDAKAFLAHGETDAHVKRLRITNGWTRKEVFEHLASYMENDEEAPLTPVRAIDLAPRRRKRTRSLEASPA